MQMTCSMFAKRTFRHWYRVLFILALSVTLCGPQSAAAAPTVTAASPAAGSTDVPASTTVTATFSEPLDPATVTAGSFVLSQPVRVNAIAAGYNFTLLLKDNGSVSGWGCNGSGQTSVPAGLGGIIAIAAGSNHAAALKNDGTVTAWGDNALGQTTVPAGLAGVTALAAGGSFTLALKTDATVVAWGANTAGQTDVPGGLSGVTRIAAGSAHAVALKSNGTVAAWGSNSSGQTTVPAGLGGVIAVAAGGGHSVALKADGSVVAWGANGSGQISVPAGLTGVIAIAAGFDYTLALKNDGSVVAWGDNTSGQSDIPVGLSGIAAIAGGNYHAVALKSAGNVISWGDNSCSQITLPAGLSGVTAAAAGDSHTVALKSDGTLSAWGYNSNGQASIPAGISGITTPAAGFAHTLALNAAGSVSAWGSNDYGQTTIPAGLAGVIDVAAGDNHSVALKSDGTVVAWGLDSAGQATVPGGLSAVTKIAAGTAHTLALKQDGTVAAWGSNSYNAVTPPVGLSAVTAIAAAGYHSVALKSDGTLSAWGDDTWGQSTVPAGLSGVIAVAAGISHTAALKSDGTVVAWGANGLGQSSVPAGLSGVVGIAAGNGYTVAVKYDGTLVSWGDNRAGQSTVPQDPYGQDIATSIDYSTGSNTATLTPAAALPQATTLTATVNRGVRSLEGTHPAADYSWSFTTVDTTPPVTTVSPAGGTYTSLQNVTLTANEPATIYYTTNGAAVTTASPVYSGPIQVTVLTALRFFARDTAGNSEAPRTEFYSIIADTIPPETTASPAGGTYSSVQNVTLTANEAATIYYTTNGTTPAFTSPVYSGAIPIPASTTLKFFALDTAGNSEAVKTAVYTLNLDTTPPVTTASPPGGTYTSAQSVILTANESATIYYTVNGDTPTTSSPIYSGAIAIPATSTLKFFAKDTAGNNETVKTEVYTLNLDTTPPDTTASPAGGTYSSAQSVTLTANEAATIYYTINGSTPTFASPVYSGAIAIPASTTLKFFAKDTAGNSEAVKTAVYIIDATPPVTTASPAGGTYNSAQSVTLTANEAATIYYTINGSIPTVASLVYSGAIAIPASTTLKFFAKDTAGNSEAVKTAVYTIDTTPPVTTAAPAGGTYSSAQSVTLTANEPATIHYTTNGSVPSTSSPVYAGSIAITVTSVLKFFARDTAGNSETVKTESYTIKQNQTITFGALPAKAYGDPAFTLGATASSGLPVSYTSSNSAVATVSGTTLTIVGAGSAVITASQGGDSAYNPATAVGQTLTVNKAVLTVQAANATREYGAANPAFSASYSGFVNGDTQAALSGSPGLSTAAIATSPAGTHLITAAAGSLAAANYSFSFVNGTLTVTKAGQTITFGSLPARNYGDPAFSLEAISTSGLPISYTSSNTAVATVSGTTLTIVGAGSATITASQVGDGNYYAAVAVAQGLTVTKAALTVQAADVIREYGLANPALSATYSGFVNGDSEAVLSGSAALSTAATAASPVGAYPIMAAAGTLAAANYSFSFVNGLLTVTKADQAITFGALPAKTYGEAAFALTATAGSGLPVTYSSSNPAVATVSGTTLTIVGAGTATITASQEGDAAYNPATAVVQALTVTKASLTVQAVDAARVYGVANPAFSTTYSGFVNGESETVLSGSAGLSTVATAISPVGSYPVIAAAGTLAAANYSFSFVNGSLTVTKADQAITFGALPAKTYGDAEFALAAAAGSGLPVTYSSSNPAVATVSGTTLTIVGAGTATITASQVGDGNYNAAPDAAQSLTVSKAAASVTLGSLSTTYDGTPKAATATTVPAGLTVTFTYNGAAIAPTAVASYSVVGTISDPNYQGSVSGTLTIAKGNQTITFGALPVKTYGNAAFTLAASASSGLAVTYTSSNSAVATVSGSTVTIIGAGTAVITANQAGDGNYNAAPAVAQTLTVNKAVATIVFGQLIFTYDNDTPMPVTVTTIPAGLAVTITYDGSPDPPFDTGNYTVVATVVDANYQGTATAIEEIARRNQTITFAPLPAKTYGDAVFTLAATASSGLTVTYTSSNTAVATISSSKPYKVTIIGAGTSIITAYQVGNKRWNDAPPVAQTLTVNKAAGTVTLGSLSATYDGTAKAATATTTPSGRAVTFTYNGSAVAPAAAGSYSVIGTINDANYQGSASGTLVIAKTGQTITFGALPAKSYGNAPFSLNASASSGLAISYTSSNPAVATVSGTTVTIVGVGTTTITASQGGDVNYNAAAAVPQTLTVSKGTATVTLGNLTASYNGTPRLATATTVPDGLPVTLTYNGSATAPLAVGTYTVAASVTDANYEGSNSGTLTIDQGTQTITFGAIAAKTYGDADITLAATASSGLAISYTSSNPAVATVSGTTVTIVGAGTAIITASQGGDGNYNAAAAVPQTLTVSKGAATVTLGSLDTSYNGTARPATAITVPNGLPVTFTYNGSATLPLAVGTYTVVATISDANYEGNTTGTLTIAKGAQTISFGTLSARTYGEPAFNLTATAGSSLPVSYTSSNPAVATISGTTVTIVGVGDTTITANQMGDGNYHAATAVPQTLTVDKGAAAVTLGSLSATYNGTPRAATATTVPNGLSVTLTYNGSATAPTAAGSYTVAATINSPNYQGSSTGTLTIAKGAQTITFGSLPVKTVGNAPFTLSATATSGLAINYTSSNQAVATISGTTVTIVGAGTATITATQGGDGNYDAANAAAQVLTVNAAQPATGKMAVTIGASTNYYDTVTAAFAAVTPGSTVAIRLQTLTFAETVSLNVSGATISFSGGYDSNFTSATGMTAIQGNLVITAGTLIADRLVIM